MNYVKLGSVIKQVRRGCPLERDELDPMISYEKTNCRYIIPTYIEKGYESKDVTYLKEIKDELEPFCANNNDVLVSMFGFPAKSLVIKKNDDEKLLVSYRFYIFELDLEKIDPYYFVALIQSQNEDNNIIKAYTNVRLSRLVLEKLKLLDIPLPSLEDQKKIGQQYLDTVNHIINLHKKIEEETEHLSHII